MTGRTILRTMVTVLVLTALALPAALAQRGPAAGGQAPAAALDGIPSGTLTQEEIAGIVWMREEEKLARDVYTALGERFALPAFTNIAASEQAHMDAVGALLERYGIEDPAAGQVPGAFTDPELQRLYDTLLADGTASLASALRVGATIEEVDIADLQARAGSAPDVALVFGALERGSDNHLRAFTRLYRSMTNEAYQPQILDAAEYLRITSGG